jgi:prepilin-type processing-associated H-X9-DG protein
MTPTLKKQLTMLCGAVIMGGLLWNGGALRAQDAEQTSVRAILGIKTPRIKLTRDEAARNFVALLQLFGSETYSKLDEPSAAVMSSFSIKSETADLVALSLKMAEQWKQPIQTVKIQSEGDHTAIVTVETEPQSVSRPLVLIQEGDSWGVDMVETYAKWNNLEGSAKTEAIAQLSTEFDRARENARRSSCQSNLKQISLGLLQYVQDYDEKLPPAKPWIDVLMPYLKTEYIFKCPSVTDPKGYGYAYNSKLSNKPFDILPLSSQTVSIYETTVLKRNAYGMGENPAFRHAGGANYAFADGHVKWFDKSKTPSFNLKP